MLRAAAYAPSRAAAKEARKAFAGRYGDAHRKAVKVLEDDWDRMTAFHAFPEKHRRHLRTTNVVESPVRLGPAAHDSREALQAGRQPTALIWRLLIVAEKRFRKLNAPELLRDAYEGRRFEDGKPVPEGRQRVAA